MIRILHHNPDAKTVELLEQSALPVALSSGQGTIWIDIQATTESQENIAQFLQVNFQFHPLAIEDALQQIQVAKVDDWGDYLYLAMHGVTLHPENGLELQELDTFLGKHYLITIHNNNNSIFNKVWDSVTKSKDIRLCASPDRLLYHILDHLCTQSMETVEKIDERLDEIEENIYEKPHRSTVSELFHLRRSVLRLRRCFSGQREAVNRLSRDYFSMINQEGRVYFRDIYDHLVRMFEITDGLRDMVSGALESYMSVTSARTNEIMRTLTVVTVLFMPLTFITGFFGMNFFGDQFNVNNPFDSPWEFAVCMVALIAVPVVMLLWMMKRGWLQSNYVVAEFHERSTGRWIRKKKR